MDRIKQAIEILLADAETIRKGENKLLINVKSLTI